jgi:hypothetical protein
MIIISKLPVTYFACFLLRYLSFIIDLEVLSIIEVNKDSIIYFTFVARIFPSLVFVFQFTYGDFPLWLLPVILSLEKFCTPSCIFSVVLLQKLSI